jgi:hypothetical protein
MRVPLVTIIASAVLVTAWATANGQESPKQTVFEPFDFWQKAQLGATSLVNPTTAGKAKVLYSYDPNHLIGKISELDSATIAKQGKSLTWEPVPEAEASQVMTSLSAGRTVPNDYRVLTQEMVSGVAGQQVIAWPNQ